MQPFWISEHSSPNAFPDVEYALDEPNGLLAAGGDLTTERLLCAYRHGIFPWYSDDQPILWWSPNPRAVLFPPHLKVSRSLRKTLRRGVFKVTMDNAFSEVVSQCAEPRRDGNGTWITSAMAAAYVCLHRLGYAHSVECWVDDRLAGGLYGVAMGKVFFGESMFSRERDASKVALHHLCQQGLELIDCQVPSAHLASMGAVMVPRTQFTAMLDQWCNSDSLTSRGVAS